MFRKNYRNKCKNPKFIELPLQQAYNTRLCTKYSVFWPWYWFNTNEKCCRQRPFCYSFEGSGMLEFWELTSSSVTFLQAGCTQATTTVAENWNTLEMRSDQKHFYSAYHRAAVAQQTLLIRTVPKWGSYRAYKPPGCASCSAPKLCHLRRTMVNNESNWILQVRRLQKYTHVQDTLLKVQFC